MITVMGMEVTIRPCRDAKTVVNGRPLTGERVLEHKDRVLFGRCFVYVCVHFKIV